MRRCPLRLTGCEATAAPIDSMMHWGAIQPFHLGGEMRLHQLHGDDLDVKYESLAGDPVGGFEISCQACSSSSKTLASFKSRVWKPSVNQP